MSDDPQTSDPMIAALLREREGLARRGLPERVAQVDEQLKARGYQSQAETPQTPPGPETPEGLHNPPADAATADQDRKATAPRGRRAPAKTET